GHRAHQATAPLTPAELYYKALIDKFGDILDENLSHTLAGYLPKGFTALDYQLDAVKQCRHILHEHGGFLLSDVVGLGKTIVAVLLAKHFLIDRTETTRRPRRVLIVAPPAVLSAWRETVARFDADTDTPISPYIDFTTPGRIGQLLGSPLADIPQSNDETADEDLDLFDLAADSDNPTDEDPDTADAVMELDGEQDGNTTHCPKSPDLVSLTAALPAPDYGLLLIDESHRLRHHNTRSYRQLDTLIGDITARHGLCPYIGLLSATPQNNRPQDLRNQIYLFARNRTASTFTKACGGNLEHFFSEVHRRYDNLLRNTSISPAERNEALAALAAEIRDGVLQDILVRRTRTDVQRYYNADLRFPEVADPESLHYRLSKSLAELFAHTTELIGPQLAGFFDAHGNEDTQAPHLSAIGYFRYRALEFFVNSTHIERYAWRNMTTQRIAVQLARLSQINLIKRFESSFTAFKTSLTHLRHNTQTMIDMWENDTIFVCPAFDVNALFDRKRRYELTGRRLTFDDVVSEIRQKIAALPPE
ncbi:MAG: DEAD/DEAH box helicase family protein, partial [Prevotellaceae bacterium]|nr:DEAD/DEAH box helicase family protein [Prevotellaceae bacterium]